MFFRFSGRKLEAFTQIFTIRDRVASGLGATNLLLLLLILIHLLKVTDFLALVDILEYN
jgi:hypothetical protein